MLQAIWMTRVFEVVFWLQYYHGFSLWVGGKWGGWGSCRRVKANIQMETAVLCHDQVTRTGKSHRVGQVFLSLSVLHSMQSYYCPSGATQAMKRIPMVWQRRKKATSKSRRGHLISSAWCLWIVRESGFRLQTKKGFQYLCP